MLRRTQSNNSNELQSLSGTLKYVTRHSILTDIISRHTSHNSSTTSYSPYRALNNTLPDTVYLQTSSQDTPPRTLPIPGTRLVLPRTIVEQQLTQDKTLTKIRKTTSVTHPRRGRPINVRCPRIGKDRNKPDKFWYNRLGVEYSRPMHYVQLICNNRTVEVLEEYLQYNSSCCK
jgi:hypothetical protein